MAATTLPWHHAVAIQVAIHLFCSRTREYGRIEVVAVSTRVDQAGSPWAIRGWSGAKPVAIGVEKADDRVSNPRVEVVAVPARHEAIVVTVRRVQRWCQVWRTLGRIAQEHVRTPTPLGLSRRRNQHVCDSVAVDVAAHRDAGAEHDVWCGPGEGLRSDRGQSGRSARKEVDLTGEGGIGRSADHHVGVPISVGVAPARERPEGVPDHLTVQHPGRAGRRDAGGTPVHEQTPGARLRLAHGEVVVPVPVDVTDPCHQGPKVPVRLGSPQGQRRYRPEAVRRTQVKVRCTRLFVVVGADDHVIEAISVDVPGTGHGLAELLIEVAVQVRQHGGRREVRAAGGARVHQQTIREVAGRGQGHREVLQSVPVYVAYGGDHPAEHGGIRDWILEDPGWRLDNACLGSPM